MSYQDYIIDTEGSSNGNVLATGFKISVCKMHFNSDQFGDELLLEAMTFNVSGDQCANDDIPNNQVYSLPLISKTNATNLVNSIEVLLQDKYPDNWSKA